MATMTPEDILTKVREVLVDALGVDDEEVTPQARLVADLNAESIDFLDIVFRLEKAFGVKIEQGEMFPEKILTDEKYVQGGKITDEGMAVLRQKLQHANLDSVDKDRRVEEISNVFTVEAVVRFIQGKLK